MDDRIERELLLAATPPEVWEVIVAPGWLADQVELELAPGGEARFTSETEVRTGWVEEAAAPSDAEDSARLVFWWSADEQPATRVAVTLSPAGEAATRLRILEERPLEALDAIGMPAPGQDRSSLGPLMLSLA